MTPRGAEHSHQNRARILAETLGYSVPFQDIVRVLLVFDVLSAAFGQEFSYERDLTTVFENTWLRAHTQTSHRQGSL